MNYSEFKSLVSKHEIVYVDLRFADTRGKEQHVTVPESEFDEEMLLEGKPFDGSSISGWRAINASDMLLKPDLSTVVIDPFVNDPTVNVLCDVFDPSSGHPYNRDPRYICRSAERYMVATGIADKALFGPEPEFFIFDGMRWEHQLNKVSYQIDSEEGAWASASAMEGGNPGHRPRVKGGYFPVPPVDSHHDLRAEMCSRLGEMGLTVEVHHHEVGTAGQAEIGTRFDTMLKRADLNQILKYVVHNVAHFNGRTATFMPKPISCENGSGMHVHQSLAKDGKNIFAGNKYAGLSQDALYYIGGIFKHARALNAFTNASTNSYKRLVPGFEAPVLLCYSSCNRSAAVRIPYSGKSGRRIEVRFPDASGNPYLTFASMLMAGLDGIRNKLSPGDALDANLYALEKEEEKKIPRVCATLGDALLAMGEDRDFLRVGNVFDDDTIDAYIALKQEEVDRVRSTVHPVEFEMSYSC